MENFESDGNNITRADGQLKGFDIKNNSILLGGEYEKIFDGIESESLDALFQEFENVLDTAPEDVKNDIREGHIQIIETQAEKFGWAKEKIKQLVVFALLTMNAGQAVAADVHDKLDELPRAQIKIDQSKQIIGMSREQLLERLREKKSSQHRVDVTPKYENVIPTQGEKVTNVDGQTVILSGLDSKIKKNPDGSVEMMGATVID